MNIKNNSEIINRKAPKLQKTILTSFFVILIILLLIMGVSQYLNMKKYLVNSKIKELQARVHSIDFKVLSTIEDVNPNNSQLKTISSQLADRIINVSIIDKNGVLSYKEDSVINSNKLYKQNLMMKDKVNHKGVDFDRFTPVSLDDIPIYSSDKYITLMSISDNLENEYKIDKNQHLDQILIWRKIGDINSPSGLIQLSASIRDIDEILEKQLYIFIVVSLSILLIGALIGRIIFRKALTPLRKMTNLVELISADDLHTRLNENNGSLEINSLSHSFNNMLERIEDSFEKEQYMNEKMKQFISDASHELRTPLTSIKGFVEVLLMGAAKNESQLNLALNSILSESDRLTKLVSDLLTLSKIDQSLSVEMKCENLCSVINEIKPQLLILSENRNVIFDLMENSFSNINKNQMKQVIFNIFQNAVLHTDKYLGEICIKIKNTNSAIIIEISDNGSGISKEHINKIFNRFFRNETHRSRTYGGYGLGLSIVKGIIDSHGGKIDVYSNLGQGTKFVIQLKKCD